MKPTLLRLIYWEWRRLRSERTNLLLLGVWGGLLAVAAWQGASMTAVRHTEIDTARAATESRWEAWRVELIEIEAGRREPQKYGDPRNPVGLIGDSRAQTVSLLPTPLAATAAAVKRAGMITQVHVPSDNLENPANRLAGRFDLLFVVSALLPLFVLAFAFDVLSRERELGIWPLVASQPINTGWLVVGRLGLHFVLLWVPLVVAASASVFAALPAGAALIPAVGEIACWVVLAGAYLLFWQALAAWVNFRGFSAAGNALALCAAWLVFVLLVPALVEVAVRTTTTAPDRLGLVLAERDSNIDVFNRAEALREEFYARYGYERPQGELTEIDFFFVTNILPRGFAMSEAIGDALDEVGRRRELQSRRNEQLAWASPALAFRRASEKLAGVTPLQQGVLLKEAREYQKKWRAHYGAKAASMTPLTAEDYETKPEPPIVRLPFTERLSAAFPSIVAVLLASGGALGWATASRRERSTR